MYIYRHLILITIDKNVFSLPTVVTVDGIRCHVCEGVNNNDLCNTRVAECTDSGHDACYTRIQRPDQNIKTYSKVGFSLIIQVRKQL